MKGGKGPGGYPRALFIMEENQKRILWTLMSDWDVTFKVKLHPLTRKIIYAKILEIERELERKGKLTLEDKEVIKKWHQGR